MQRTPYQQFHNVNQSPPVTIVTHQSPTLPDKFQTSAVSQMTVLCITQIVMGIFSVIFGIVLTALDYNSSGYQNLPHAVIGYHGYGIWAGVYFFIVGGIGMVTVKSNRNGWIISTMILNILCSVIFCWVLLSYSSAGLVLTAVDNCHYNWYSNNYQNFCEFSLKNTYLAMDSLLLLISVIQFVITIWCAILCCGAVCNCCKDPVGGSLVQQQVIATYPMAQTQTGVTVQHRYMPGVHQVPVGGYVATPQPPPGYVSQAQVPPIYSGHPAQAPGQAPAAVQYAGVPGVMQ